MYKKLTNKCSVLTCLVVLLLTAVLPASSGIAQVAAHPTPATAKSDSDLLYPVMSLPDLIKATSNPPSYEFINDASLQEGRIVLTPKTNSKGSIWSKAQMDLPESFTIEWVFRSMNFQESEKANGGMALWVTDSQLSQPYLTKDTVADFKFNGLLLYIDSNGPSGTTQIRGIINDNNEKQFTTMEELNMAEFGSCILGGYQDFSLPITVRLTYDNENDKNYIKLQIDNRVCFQTRQISLAKGLNKKSIKVGVSAQNGENSDESFELLKLNYYEGVIADSLIPNFKQMQQPIYITKVVNQDTGEISYLEKTLSDNVDVTLNKVYNKLNKIEGKVLANDVAALYKLLEEVVTINKKQSKRIESLINTLESSALIESAPSSGTGEYKDFIKMNDKLEALLIEQRKLRDLDKKEKESSLNSNHFDDLLYKLLLWISPLIVLMLVMAYYTFRIKQEIVKTKLL